MKGIKPERIICSVVLDFMGAGDLTPEEEFEQLKKDIGEVLANPVDYTDAKMVHRIKEGSRLVIFDFGGLMPGTNLMEDQSRQVITWASEHPNALVLVISTFTFSNFIQPEMESLGMTTESTPNIKQWNQFDALPEWPGFASKPDL